jgi:hypothetical protein
MAPKSIAAVLATCAAFSATNAYSRRRCTFGDYCWPDNSNWQALNESVSAHLMQSVPSASVCHKEYYDATLCDTAQKEWKKSLWRTNQSVASSAILWELGDDQCFINSPVDAPCEAGLGKSLPPYVGSQG